MTSEKHEFSHQHEPPVERRSSERISSVYRPVLIETEEFAGFCLVKNLSPGGMMGFVYAQFALNQPVTVQFHPDHVVSGTISWSKDGRIGIQFDEEIDVEKILRKLADKHVGTKINRSPRLQIECEGALEFDGRSIPIKLRDISQKGIKVEVFYLKPGDEVIVRLPGIEPHKALVRWTQSGLAGLNFIRPISFEELATWVIGHQSQ